MMMLPHTRTARFLETVIRRDATSIEATGRIPAAHPAIRDHRAPSFLGIELGAQAAAAMATEPVQGFLARIREAEFSVPDFPADAELRVIVELEGSAGSLAIYRIRVFIDEAEIMRGTISVMVG